MEFMKAWFQEGGVTIPAIIINKGGTAKTMIAVGLDEEACHSGASFPAKNTL